jgi:hypothetical protein
MGLVINIPNSNLSGNTNHEKNDLLLELNGGHILQDLTEFSFPPNPSDLAFLCVYVLTIGNTSLTN